MAKKHERMTSSEKKKLILKEIDFMEQSIESNDYAQVKSSDYQEISNSPVFGIIDCSCIFEEEGKEIYVDERVSEKKIQRFMNRYPVEQAEIFAMDS